MDIQMPVMDGLEATRRMLEPAGRPAPRVIILTTFELDEYVFEALRAGASGFLVKNTPPEELVTAIRSVVAGGGLLSPGVTAQVIGAFAHRRASDRDARRLATLTEREREVLGPRRARPVERGDRRAARPRRGDGQDPRLEHPGQARAARPGRCGDRRLRIGPIEIGAAGRASLALTDQAGRRRNSSRISVSRTSSADGPAASSSLMKSLADQVDDQHHHDEHDQGVEEEAPADRDLLALRVRAEDGLDRREVDAAERPADRRHDDRVDQRRHERSRARRR